MRHWWQLGTRNWRAKPGRTARALGAIALGVGVVVWVTCAYESVRLALRDQVWFWIGRSHLSVEGAYGEQGTVLQAIADEAAGLPNVRYVTYRLKQRMTLEKLRPSSGPAEGSNLQQEGARRESGLAEAGSWSGPAEGVEVQAIGIRPEMEGEFRQYDPERVPGGRMLQSGDTDAAVVDRTLAADLDLKIGDRFALRVAGLDSQGRPTEKSAVFRIVGLLEHRRIAKQQKPVVLAALERIQELAGYYTGARRVTKIDLLLKDTSWQQLSATESKLRRLAGRYGEGFIVSSSQAKLKQVEAAERQTQFIMLLISSVALFTAFFIILSTLSMGVVERAGQLGTLRCLGMTRLQMAVLVLGEAGFLGVVGTVLGIPVGLGLGQLTVHVAREYIGTFAINWPGMVLAVGGGVLTTLAGALLPMVQTMQVSPLAASRSQSQPAPGVLAWIFGVLGLGMIAGHMWMIGHLPPNKLYQTGYALSTVALLYGGYACVVPAAIRIVGLLAVRIVAVVVRLRHRLLADQVGRAVWRSSAICCGLMVGLSLIVTLVVHSESIAAGWNFPKDFCEAYVFLGTPIDRAVAEQARRMSGMGEGCLVNTNIRCTVYGKGLFHFPISSFIAGEADEFFRIANLEFVKGSKEEAIAKLRRGGYVLVTPEFVRTQRLDYGDRVLVRPTGLVGAARQFEIAGVVKSPALDIAANYFNAGDALLAQSVYVVLGTFADARKAFGVRDGVSLYLFNFDLPASEPPPEFCGPAPPDPQDAAGWAALLAEWRPLLPERRVELDQIAQEVRKAPSPGQVRWLHSPVLRLFRESMGAVAGEWSSRMPQERWQVFREELVMQLVALRSGVTWQEHGSVRALKERIDRDLRRATRLFATFPMVALIVAALGVGNLMMANIASRSRQLATLRAVGATRWQIIRLVIGEALVLGALGCAVGVLLGLHAAYSINRIVELIWGYRAVWAIPYGWLMLSIAFTLLVCLLAGLAPASRAARTNIIDALQTT